MYLITSSPAGSVPCGDSPPPPLPPAGTAAPATRRHTTFFYLHQPHWSPTLQRRHVLLNASVPSSTRGGAIVSGKQKERRPVCGPPLQLQRRHAVSSSQQGEH
ncbi:hypothetical protein JDV02_006277 [Purpureocillium takamizusanense]|uniref:Uncharacterized protein n=1 Tax=Purpureocillium takamizusanense TaxID=2060973 RepID=A0A9Q8QIB2_9HYPO|nr:uncharacterized protein JDV02_006277 [Purpureocillium takamizusanense]UNI20160.1 hypothetical protein JDV02_006277 [Purpureocillium takamizusanense]